MINNDKSRHDLEFRLLSGFMDSEITPDLWNSLLTNGSSDVIFMTWHWQKAWWQVFGRGKLLITVAIRDGKPVAIASLFTDGGMIFFVGSGCADELDFIGDISDPNILEGMITLAINEVSEFLGCRLYHVPKLSATHESLKQVSNILKFQIFDEGELPLPKLSIKNSPDKANEAIAKKSLVRHERWFRKNGNLTIENINDNHAQIYLNDFFEQHIKRWEASPFPSLFNDPLQRTFYKCLCKGVSSTGWLRFTRVIWRNRTISFHFGFNYRGSYIWYKPSFDISLAKHSPGEVLLRQLMIQAIDEGAHTFDFGLGDEAFKTRFATNTRFVKTVGLYTEEVIMKSNSEKSIGL